MVTGNGQPGTAAELPNPELYDPATGTWAVTGARNISRVDFTATLLPDGQVLAAGGSGSSSFALSSAEQYNPATGTWAHTGSMTTPREGKAQPC